MLREQTAARNKRARGETRFPGLCRHAEALNVHRNHLWLVLEGRRQSKSLLNRYKALLQSEGRPVPPNLGTAA